MCTFYVVGLWCGPPLYRTFCFGEGWFDLSYSLKICCCLQASPNHHILTKKKKTLLNLMNTPSQILPFMAHRGVKSNPQLHEANAIWFFSPALFGNCSEVPRGQLLVKSNGRFCFSFVDCRAICHLSFWAAPAPATLPFITCNFSCCISYPSDYCFQLLWLLTLISVSICGCIFSSHCFHEGRPLLFPLSLFI